jgi:hypothetical protein
MRATNRHFVMIFQYTWPAVVSERKTQTRRIIQPNETAIREQHNKIKAVVQGQRERWRVSASYAVQTGRGKAQIARIRLTRIRSQLLSRITTSDALAEGFASRQDFLKTWQHIHGIHAVNQRVWVLEFEIDGINPDISLPSLFKRQKLLQLSALSNAK